MSPIDDILHRYMSGNNNNGELTAQNVRSTMIHLIRFTAAGSLTGMSPSHGK